MAITAPPPITALPDAPVRGDRATFRAKAEAFVSSLSVFRTELSAVGSNVYSNAGETYTNSVTSEAAAATATSAASDAEDARDIAQAAGDVRGVWSALTGSLPIGAAVAHVGRLWVAVTAIADVTASEPSYSNAAWLPVTPAPGGELSKNSAYTVTGADDKTTITCTAVLTLSFESASVLGSGWSCYVKNTSSGDVTLDPYSTQTIDGVSTGTVESGDMFFIRSNGSNLVCEKIAGYKAHYITSSQTWTCPAGINSIYVQLQAAGGGGSRSSTTAVKQSGSGGSYAEKTIQISAGTSKTITIGSPGAGAQTDDSSGTDAGVSSFDSDITASGGVGGSYTATSATIGGDSAGGDLNISGGAALGYSGNGTVVISGGSFFGAGDINSTTFTPVKPNIYGVGGCAASTGKNAADGGDAICIVWY